MDGRGDQEFIVEEGTIVRERQVIINLPNADSMRVNLTVNESLVQYVHPGLAAVISPVGLGDRVLHGTVDKINQYAEPTGWRQANVKEYKAFVSIDESTSELRSGMTTAVMIRCAEVPNALQVPVQAVYAHGSKFYCFVFDQGAWEAREIKPGPTNDKFFVVNSGLNEGDQVAMNPRAYRDEVNLPKLSPADAQRAVPQRGNGQSGKNGAQNAPAQDAGQPGQTAPGQQPEVERQQPGQPLRNAPGDTRVPANRDAAGQVKTASVSTSQGTAE
jgi:hypothetical protein